MSYILDALKKVAREKATKANAGGMTSISGDLFQERAPRPSRDGAGKIVVVIVLVSVATFAATWFVLKGDDKKTAVTARSAVPTVVTTPTVRPNAPIPPPPAAAPTTPPRPQQIPVPRAPATTDSAPQPIKTAVQTIPAPTDIKVSGIAWQEEKTARRVVVNGFLLQEGTTVSGAKILEIHQDRVRFSSPAGIFDVRMDAATLSGTPKTKD